MQEDDSNASAPTETHPLLPLQGDAPAPPTDHGTEETAVQEQSTSSPSSSANPNNDEDITDDCCRRSTPPCADVSGVVSCEPKSTTGNQSEYKAIYDMLKDAEKSANDPEYEEKAFARRFGAIKYNPRNPESSFGAVDYLCALFQCCAVCIEGWSLAHISQSIFVLETFCQHISHGSGLQFLT